MIGAFKRVFRGSEEAKPGPSWVVNERIEAEEVDGQAELPSESPQGERRGVFVPYDTDVVQQQVELIRAAIALGGRFGDHEIPMPWLRMTLAGLEGRPIDQEAMWEGIAAPPRKDPVEESPTYQELFPSGL